MSSQGITYDELSQAISESYLHLSQDETNDITGSSMGSHDMTGGNSYDTTTLMKLARAIDEHQRSKGEKGQKHASTDLGSMGSERVRVKSPMQDTGLSSHISSHISSQSTPLVSKQGQGGSKYKHGKSRSEELADVDEEYEDVYGNDTDTKDTAKMALGELQRMFQKLSLAELEEFKKPIEELIQSSNRRKQQHSSQNQSLKSSQNGGRDLYVTPKKSYINALSSDSGSSDEDEDDRLGLSGVHLSSKHKHKANLQKPNHRYRPTRSLSNNSNSSSDDDDDKLSLTGDPLTSNESHSNNIQTRKSPARKSNNRIPHIDEQELGSAITTPPHSQEYSNFKKSTYSPQGISRTMLAVSEHSGDLESLYNTSYIPRRVTNRNPTKYNTETVESASETRTRDTKIDKLEQNAELLRKENLNLRIKSNELEIKLAERESKGIVNHDESSLNDNSFIVDNADVKSARDRIDELTHVNNQLSLQLSNSRNHSQELNNEIRYLKSKNNDNHNNNKNNNNNNNNNDNYNDNHENSKSRITDLESKITALQAEIGNPKNLLTPESLSDDYKEFYYKLQLSQVDKLTKFEMSNLIKNLMLSLLITDFEHLPIVSSKIGKFFKIISLFMDQLHSMVYDDSSAVIRPSHYLKNHEYGMEELQSCLDGMLETLQRPSPRST